MVNNINDENNNSNTQHRSVFKTVLSLPFTSKITPIKSTHVVLSDVNNINNNNIDNIDNNDDDDDIKSNNHSGSSH